MGHITALILAAGEGKRMKSDKAKVIHEIYGKAMIEWVYEAARGAGIEKCVAIVGHKAEQVKEYMGNKVDYVLQEQQLGTGHAVQQAHGYISGSDGSVVVLCGDVPLISSNTIKKAIEYMDSRRFKAVVITGDVLDPHGYGRIVRDSDGNFERIVEQRDASEEEKAICEINSGMYVFSSKELEMALGLLSDDNAQKEYYLTDTLEILLTKGYSVGVYKAEDNNEVLGVNDRIQLEHISEIMEKKIMQ